MWSDGYRNGGLTQEEEKETDELCSHLLLFSQAFSLGLRRLREGSVRWEGETIPYPAAFPRQLPT